MKRKIAVGIRLQDGNTYPFTVTGLDESTSPKGVDQLRFTLNCHDLETDTRCKAWDRFLLDDENGWKIGLFLEALGFARQADGNIEIDDEKIIGRTGYLLVSEKVVKGTTFQNFIYLKPGDPRLDEVQAQEDEVEAQKQEHQAVAALPHSMPGSKPKAAAPVPDADASEEAEAEDGPSNGTGYSFKDALRKGSAEDREANDLVARMKASQQNSNQA